MDYETMIARALDYPHTRFSGASAPSMAKAKRVLAAFKYHKIALVNMDDNLFSDASCQTPPSTIYSEKQ